MHVAISYGDEGCVRELLVHEKIDLNPQELYYEATPFHLSITLNSPNIAMLLVEHGANPDVRDMSGMTPAEQAKRANIAIKAKLHDPGNYHPYPLSIQRSGTS